MTSFILYDRGDLVKCGEFYYIVLEDKIGDDCTLCATGTSNTHPIRINRDNLEIVRQSNNLVNFGAWIKDGNS